jgi:hypothetical protein
MTTRLSPLHLIAGLGVLLLSSCDGGNDPPPDSVIFNGVTYNALGQARLSVQGGVLVVDNIGTAGADGVHVDVADEELDSLGVLIQPLTLGDAAIWGLAVFGDIQPGVEAELAAAWAEDIGGGRNAIQVSFVGGIGLDQVVFEYYLADSLIVRSPPVPTDNFTSTVASAGTTNVGPNSVHAVREGGVVVIGTDYRVEGFAGGGPAGAGCTAALIEVAFQPEAVCADYVRAVPLASGGGGMPPAYSADVAGRSIGRFVITDGAVE